MSGLELVVVGNLAEDVIFGESYFGGCAGNIGINAAALGMDVAVLSNYGHDDFSYRYVDRLQESGVNTDLLQQGLQTIARFVVSSNVNHSSSVEWQDNGTTEALGAYEPTPAQVALLGTAKYIHFTSIGPAIAKRLIPTLDPGTTVGYEPGLKVIKDTSRFDPEVFRMSDFLFLNGEESAALDRAIGIDALRGMMRPDQRIIISRGEHGVSVLGDLDTETQEFASEFPVAPEDVVDSNGAGDSFKVGFYLEMLRSGDIAKAIQLGNFFGSLMVQQEGPHFTPAHIDRLREYVGE